MQVKRVGEPPLDNLTAKSVALLDGAKSICYKNCPRPQHSLLLCEGAYSAVAQWQSIRLLTEGL